MQCNHCPTVTEDLSAMVHHFRDNHSELIGGYPTEKLPRTYGYSKADMARAWGEGYTAAQEDHFMSIPQDNPYA